MECLAKVCGGICGSGNETSAPSSSSAETAKSLTEQARQTVSMMKSQSLLEQKRHADHKGVKGPSDNARHISSEAPTTSALSIQALLLKQDPARSLMQYYEEPGKKLGEGGFGSVLKLRHKETGQLRCVKIIDLKADDMDLVSTELSVLINLDHPNVLKCFEWFEEATKLYIVTEICEGGELVELLVRKGSSDKKPEISEIFYQILSAVNYCHGLKVVHRDLKLENCLLKNRDEHPLVKVIDFGLAAIQADKKFEETLGTPFFVAPEVINRHKRYTEKCDLWSCGVILYILLSGQHPFYTKECAKVKGPGRLFQRVQREPPHAGPLDTMSTDAKDLVLRLLSKDPNKRPSAKEALAHPFMMEVDHSVRASLKLGGAAPDAVMENVKQFLKCDKFERVLLTVAAHQAHHKDIEKLQRLFLALDEDRSGMLSREEVKAALQDGFHFDTATPQEFERLFDTLDADKTGKITYTEWLSATLERSLLEEDKTINKAFEYFDLEGTGDLNLSELSRVLEDADAARVAMEKMDIDKDGTVTRDEFFKFVKALAKDRSNSTESDSGGD